MEKIISPMMAHIGKESDLERPHMLFEPKLDGIRSLCYVSEGLRFYSRNSRDITSEYPEFHFRDSIESKTAILDGEIIVLDNENNPSFSMWQHDYAAVYIVFDILMLNEKSLIDLPLLERKEILGKVVKDSSRMEKCMYTTHGTDLWQEIIKRGMEGVIAKQEDSHYYPGSRSSLWLKIKSYKTLDALILGYTSGKRKISSLILGAYRNGELVYIGKVGTGFTGTSLDDLLHSMKPLKITKPLMVGNILPDDLPSRIPTHWLKPELICEIKYLEFTEAGKMRGPVFLRLRVDKNPEEISFEEQGIPKSTEEHSH
jgi:bifunctional non-homologous end joining protein LigD